MLACLAGCRVPLHPLPPAMVALQRPPKKGDYKEVGRYEEKFIPGYIYYHYAVIAQARHDKLAQQEKALKDKAGEDEYARMQLKHLEQKKLEHLAKAEENLKKFLDTNQAHNAAARGRQGKQQKTGSSDEIVKCLALAHEALGGIHLDQRKYELALAQFEEVLKINPRLARTWRNIAHCYWQQGKLQKAKEAIAEALKLNPNSLEALQARGAIEEEERRRATQEAREETPSPHPQPDR